MKKKDRIVTEGVLEEKLGLLEEKLEEKFENFEKKMDKKFIVGKEEMRDEMVIMRDYLDEKSRKYRDEILTRIDSYAPRIQTLENENTIGAEHIREVKKDVASHEKRISNLEPQAA